jgi:hypothetical protein
MDEEPITWQDVVSGLAEWRQQHPRATFREIEAALDERLARLRAQLLQQAALASAATAWTSTQPDPPTCPQCQAPLTARGPRTRHLRTHGGRDVALTRIYGTCPRCGGGLFPPG